MSIDITTIGVEFQTDGLKRGERAMTDAERAANKMADQLSMAERQTRQLGDAAQTMGRMMGGALAGFGLGQLIGQIDAYTKLTAQLKLATSSTAEYGRALDEVRKISTAAQTDLQATAMLYARVKNGIAELGLGQAKVAQVTETVTLALKVSGATAAEAGSAMLQLSQAFASGTLRGEEFNAVNEAAPRMMKALADGMGVPVGALKEMASQGLITSAVMADALPRALADLRKEAESVQTISGAFVALKNNVMEFIGASAQANGAAGTLANGIGAVANNLNLIAGAAAGFAAAKLAQTLAGVATSAYASAVATSATLQANIAAATATATKATADVAATAASVALTEARVIELRAAVMAASGTTMVAVATNGLIPMQARAAEAALAHTAALAAQTAALGAVAAAQGAATVGARALSGAMAFIGGPIGLITAALGLGVAAWMAWGTSASESEKKAADAMSDATVDVLAGLDKQIKKLNERNALANAKVNINGLDAQSPAAERMGALQVEIDRLRTKPVSTDIERAGVLRDVNKLLAEQGAIQQKLTEEQQKSAPLRAAKQIKDASDAMLEFSTKTEKADAKIKQLKESLGSAFTPEMEAKVRKSMDPPKAGPDLAKKATEEVAKALGVYNDMIAKSAGLNADFSEKWASLNLALKSGKISTDDLAEAQAALLAQQPAMVKAAKAEHDALEAVTKVARARADLRTKENEGIADYIAAENDRYRQTARAAEESTRLAQEEFDHHGKLKSAIAETTLTRLQDRLVNLRAGSEAYDSLVRQIEAQKELIGILKKGEMRDASEQAAKDAKAEWDKYADQIGQSLTDQLMQGGKSGAQYIKDLFRTMVLRPVVQGVVNSVVGTAANAMGFASAASTASSAAAMANAANALRLVTSPIGLAVGALVALKNLGAFGSQFKSTSGTGQGSMSFDANGNPTSSSAVNQWGGLNATTTKAITAMQDSYAKAASALGITMAATEFSYGGNTGREGATPNFALSGGVIGRGGYSTGGETPLSEAAYNLAASRAVFAALKNSQLPGYLSKVFDEIAADTATQEQITATLQYAGSLKTVRDALMETRAPLQILRENVAIATASLGTSAATYKTDFVAALDKGITPDKLAAWQSLGTGLEQLASAADEAAAATKSAQEGIMALVKGITDKVGTSIFDMQYGMADTQGKYGMLDVRAASLNDRMMGSTDINAIAKMASDQIDLINKSWSLLAPEQQSATYLQFEEKLNQIDSFVQAKGADASSLKAASDKATADTIAAAVEAAVAKALASSSAALQAAADKADRPVVVESYVTVTAPPGAEVAIDSPWQPRGRDR